MKDSLIAMAQVHATLAMAAAQIAAVTSNTSHYKQYNLHADQAKQLLDLAEKTN